jgi:hypothetical protein
MSTPQSPDEVPVVELTPDQWRYVQTRALRVILAGLDDNDARRQASVYGELTDLALEGQAVLFAILGYLVARVASGLKRGYGDTTGAIDATTAQLAATVIAAGEPDQAAPQQESP